MKVLIVSPFYPYPEDLNGVNKINAQLLVENPFFQADLLCLIQQPDSRQILKEKANPQIITLASNIIRVRSQDKIRWLINIYPFNVAKLSPEWVKLAREIERLESFYDLIHISTPSLVPLMNHLPAYLLKKTLLFPIDSMTLYTERRLPNEPSLLMKLALKFDLIKIHRFEKRFYRRPTKVVFVSEFDCLVTKKISSNVDLACIPNGVDINYFKVNTKSEFKGPSLLFTGVMSYAPNRTAAFFLATQVMPLLRVRLKGVQLCLVGREPDRNLLALNNTDIVVTGFVEDIRDYLSRTTLYLSPLVFGSGIKNKVLEAMAMGKAVLGSSLSFEGISGEKGKDFLIEDNYVASRWADSIIHALENPQFLDEVGCNARYLIESKYSWDAIREQYGRFYESCLSNR